jgi:integrase
MPVYKYLTSSGKTRWEVWTYYKDFTGATKRTHKRGFATQREAKEFEKSLEAHDTVDRTMTFGQLYDAYKEHFDARNKITTIATKEGVFEHHILPYFKNTKLIDMTPHAISVWQTKLLDYRNEKGEPYKDTYLYRIHGTLSAIMNFAVKEYGMKQNPCKITGPIGKEKADEMAYWTLEQFNAAMAVEESPLYQAAFKTLYWTGMRLGEFSALTPADILKVAGKDGSVRYVIRITKEYEFVNGQAYIQTPKTRKSKRDIEIHKALYDEIMDYIDLVHLKDYERICLYTKAALNKELHKLAALAGVPDIHVHGLRHSHSAFMIEKKVDIATISRRLGHDNINTTLGTYGHMYPDKDHEVASTIHETIAGEDAGEGEGEENGGNASV